jgi:protein-S-isoprenylcysteine O-methyltransferase Ste14
MADERGNSAQGARSFAEALARRRVALGFVAGGVALLLASPTWPRWRAGLLIAVVGECLRIWAAGHLEKSREVTRSGPYRLMRHPLYAGSAIIAFGVAVASRSFVVTALAGLYVVFTFVAAITTEEAALTEKFGSMYDDYRAARAGPMARRFSLSRALRNREHRAVAGLIGGFALLAIKIALIR